MNKNDKLYEVLVSHEDEGQLGLCTTRDRAKAIKAYNLICQLMEQKLLTIEGSIDNEPYTILELEVSDLNAEEDAVPELLMKKVFEDA